MAEQSSKKPRWYDQQPSVSKMVSLLESFPPEYQVSLGEAIIELAEKHCKAQDVMANLRSLGPEIVLSLFKSKSKQRKLDQIQQVHQGMNYVFILPDNERQYIASQMIEIVGHLFEYIKFCQEQGAQPQTTVVSALCHAYIRQEFASLQEFLAQLEAQSETIKPSRISEGTEAFSLTGSAMEIAPAETNTSEEENGGKYDTKVSHDQKDMKIRLDKF